MRIGVLFIVLAWLLGGCATLEQPVATAVTTVNPQESPLSDAYRQLETAPQAGTLQVTLPDGFGSSGITVQRRYFSASGKDCRVIEDTDSGDRRTLCRDSLGNVNTFSSANPSGYR